MSTDHRKPVVRVTYSFKDDDGTWKNFSIFSIWAKDRPGLYRFSLDRGSEKYPAINLLDAFKRFAMGTGSLEASVESQREPYRGGGNAPRQPAPSDDFGGGDAFGDIPFDRVRGEA